MTPALLLFSLAAAILFAIAAHDFLVRTGMRRRRAQAELNQQYDRLSEFQS